MIFIMFVVNKKQIGGYRVYVEKHAMDTDDDLDAYGKLLPGAYYRVTVNQQFGENTITWTGTTDENGLIKGLILNGYGRIQITIEELEAPDGYKINDMQYLIIYRDPITGNIEEYDSNVNFDKEKVENDDEGNRIYTDRPIDIDILLFGDNRIDCEELTVPHKLMYERDFVMKPLKEINDKQ